MKKILFCLMVLFVSYCLGGSATAIPIERSDFGLSAIGYGFEDAIEDQVIVTSGILEVRNGDVAVFPNNLPPDMSTSKVYYYEQNEEALRLNFSSPVSAVGMSVMFKASGIASGDEISFSIFDNLDNELENFTLAISGLPVYEVGDPESLEDYFYGFIGLSNDFGKIAYATVATKAIFIDEIIYENVPPNAVPEPSTTLLVSLGFIVLLFARKTGRQ